MGTELFSERLVPARPLEGGNSARAALMFTLAIVFLLALGLLIHHDSLDDETIVQAVEIPALRWWIALLWLAIIVDALLGVFTAPDGWKAAGKRALLVALLPPLRMTVASAWPMTSIWLPWAGWRRVDADLYEQMERDLALPMLAVSLLILPVVVLEWFFKDLLARQLVLAMAVNLGTALIWFAFAVEFILLLTVAERKLRYCAQNWINIVIILLPLVAFLRSLRLFRVLRVAKAGKLLRAYRLRSLWTRAYRLVLLLNLIERALHRKPERYLSHLEGKAREKERELAVLRAKIAELRERLAATDAARDH
ncbi:MAG: potassium channel protein - like protein [Gammaproteobacteria bacterium]